MEETSISSSQLGKRIVMYMLLAGLIPLVVFTVPMYFQSWNVMQDNARQSLKDYSELTAGQLFQTIQQGQQRLVRLAQAGKFPVSSRERSYFSSVDRFKKIESMSQFPFYDSLDASDLRESLNSAASEVYLTSAYQTSNGPTVSMITTVSDGTFWVGEIEPSVLWETLRGSLFGERDLAMVLDEKGRILATSRSIFEPLAPIEKYFSQPIPKSGKGEGTETLDRFGNSLWISKQLWLKGAFGTGKWQLVFFRKQQAVQSLSMGLLGSLGIWLFLALAGLILISFRFARQLYQPIQKLNHATHQLTQGNWDNNFTVETGDELEDLAQNFLVMRDTIKETNDQLKHDATHDRLTGLPNRVLLEERIQHLINYTDRNEEYCFAVVFLDLDRFKVINDSLGHKAGDTLLKEIGERLSGLLRKTDMVARLGGDEFVLVLDSVRDTEKAATTVEKIVECFDQPFTIQEKDVALDSSLGIALYDDQYSSAEGMLRDADTAMYRAKDREATGSNYVIFGELMRDQAENRMDLETDIQKAIANDQFELHYQPVFDLETGETRGGEALLRWNHPEKGRIPPEKFIPLAEEIGSIQDIGHWVLSESISNMMKWKSQADRNVGWLSVNLSPKQLFNRNLIDQVNNYIERYDFNPADLKLEITENALISNVNHVADLLRKLRDLGFQICMDDFGTGHSSLSLLQELPIDVLKIDREFVTDIQDHEDRRAILQAVLSLAEEMELTMIAEGIETKLELQQLQKLGCSLGQGFLLAKPMVETDYLKHSRNVEKVSFSRKSAGVSSRINLTKKSVGKTV